MLKNILISTLFLYSHYAFSLSDELNNVISAAMENNFDIKISDYDAQDKDGQYIKAQGDFDFTLSLDSSYSKSDTPSSSSLDVSGTTSSVVEKKQSNLLTLSKKFSFGTELKIPYGYDIVDSTSSNRTIAKTYETAFSIELSQPLIKTFKPSYFTKNLKAKQYDLEIAKSKHKTEVIKRIKKITDHYFATLEAFHTINIKEDSLKNKKENLSFIKSKKRVGKASLIDLLDAESATKKEVESFESSKINFENKIDELNTLVFADNKKTIKYNFKLGKFEKFIFESNVQKLTKRAYEKRDEIYKLQKELDKSRANLKFSKLDRLPSVQLEAEIKSKGLNTNFSKANSQVTDGKYISNKIGVTVQHRIMGYAQTGSYRINKLKVEQAELKLKKMKKDILLEIKKSIRELKSSKFRIDALESSLKAEVEKYEAAKRKFGAGFISNFEINRYHQDKIKAELELLKSKISYQKAILSYKNSTAL